jgi:hypothetical protein
MDLPGIHPHAVAYPDFVRVARLGVWLMLQECYLRRDLPGKPQVVGVQKGNERAMRYCRTAITGGADTGVGLPDIPQRLAECLYNLESRVV